ATARILAQRAENGSSASEEDGRTCADPSDGAAAAARERQVGPEDDDRADDRRDPAAGREAPAAVRGRSGAEQRVPDESAHQRADHAQHGGREPAHLLAARKDGPGDEADDEAEDEESNDAHACFSPKRSGHNVCTASTPPPARAAGGRRRAVRQDLSAPARRSANARSR